MKISDERAKVIRRIEELEAAGIFDLDVEDDPPTVPLDASRVDYTCKKLSTRMGTWIANRVGKAFFEKKPFLLQKAVAFVDLFMYNIRASSSSDAALMLDGEMKSR